MLSILIPTYNYDCSELIKELHQQADSSGITYEIIIADDASTLFLDQIRKLQELSHCRVIELSANVGRSRIRNLLADAATYPYLLFMDCDAQVDSPLFIQNYLPYCAPNCVVVGGTAYDENEQNLNYSLRLKYGREREANQTFQNYFTTFNFMIDKLLFQSIRFNESLVDYGHEDSLFGVEIAHKGTIQNINNSLIHKGLDSNEQFLNKTQTAVQNLLHIYNKDNHTKLIEASKLLRTYIQLKQIHFMPFVAFCFKLSKPLLTKNLIGKNPSLFLFDLYKIGHLCAISK